LVIEAWSIFWWGFLNLELCYISWFKISLSVSVSVNDF